MSIDIFMPMIEYIYTNCVNVTRKNVIIMHHVCVCVYVCVILCVYVCAFACLHEFTHTVYDVHCTSYTVGESGRIKKVARIENEVVTSFSMVARMKYSPIYIIFLELKKRRLDHQKWEELNHYFY